MLRNWLQRDTHGSVSPRHCGRSRPAAWCCGLARATDRSPGPTGSGGPSTRTGTQDLTAGTQILGVEFDAEVWFIVMVVAPPPAAGPAAMDSLVLSLTL